MPHRFARPALLPLAVLCGVMALPALRPAMAQGTTAPAVQSPLAETVLTLSETAEVRRAPNEVLANLKAEARGPDAAAVQNQVNRAVQAALAKAREVSAVQVNTGGYWTNRDSQSRQWTASQRLTLRGTEAAPLLDLTGALQGAGLALDGLEWSLSRTVEQEARQEAGRLAIDNLRRRAAAVAEQLGMEVAGIRSLRLDAPDAPAPRMAMMRASASSMSAAPPASAPEDVSVTSTAVADVVLRARR
jgi:predicted secreted protein